MGVGWDLLGTARYRTDIGIVGARFEWFTAVIAIVVGHIIAVYLAHLAAIRALRDSRAARRSQYPMPGLMVGYTEGTRAAGRRALTSPARGARLGALFRAGG